ncbi:MAG: hypothetical protein K8T10_19485 [Candidatus Eremiobacteraeota bacterium]|nr:hypothetical protein [Candidatus Eremiobacteraeota bacterium]
MPILTRGVIKINLSYVAYTFMDDILKVLGHKFDKRQKINDLEMITTG